MPNNEKSQNYIAVKPSEEGKEQWLKVLSTQTDEGEGRFNEFILSTQNDEGKWKFDEFKKSFHKLEFKEYLHLICNPVLLIDYKKRFCRRRIQKYLDSIYYHYKEQGYQDEKAWYENEENEYQYRWETPKYYEDAQDYLERYVKAKKNAWTPLGILNRFVIGVYVAAFIIIPLVLMSFVIVTEKYRVTLIIVAIVLFWGFLEFNHDIENKDVITGTAAHAALWIIYVGSVSGD